MDNPSLDNMAFVICTLACHFSATLNFTIFLTFFLLIQILYHIVHYLSTLNCYSELEEYIMEEPREIFIQLMSLPQVEIEEIEEEDDKPDKEE